MGISVIQQMATYWIDQTFPNISGNFVNLDDALEDNGNASKYRLTEDNYNKLEVLWM